MIQETKQLEIDLETARENRDDGYKTSKPIAKLLERRFAQLTKWIEQHPDDTAKQQDLKEVKDSFELLEAEIISLRKAVTVTAAKVKSNKEKLERFKKARKSQEDSVCTGIDNILKENKIR
jgi:predicted  nucleic acid-binding Zn-ribbon protein